jgi:hypothetical protein
MTIHALPRLVALSFTLGACITGGSLSSLVNAQVGVNGRPFGPPLAPEPAPAPFPPPVAHVIDAPRPSDPPPTNEQWETLCKRPALGAAVSGGAGTRKEPAIAGRVLDRDTRQGLAGVVVFGFYEPAVDATVNGVRSSWMRDCALHVFEAVSGPDGKFIVPAWKDLYALPPPARWNVSVVFFKGGYETTGLEMENSIAGWGASAKSPKRAGSRVELTSQPIQLNRIRPFNTKNDLVELRHWQSHARASFARRSARPCDWERTPQTLLALHHERKNLIRMALGAQNLDRDGYGRAGSAPPHSDLDYTQRSEVDLIIAEQARSLAAWECSDPNKIFPPHERNAAR